MELEKICALTRKIAESENTKQESRTKPSYFTRTRKMSFSELVYYILHPFSHWPFEKMVRETTEEEYRREDVRTKKVELCGG